MPQFFDPFVDRFLGGLFFKALFLHFPQNLIFVVQIFDFGPVHVRAGLKLLANLKVVPVNAILLRWQVLFNDNLLRLNFESLSVNMGQDVLHLFEVAVRNQSVRLVKHNHVRHRQHVEQVLVLVLSHHFPQAARGSDDDSWLVLEKSDLLVDRHASHNGAHSDLRLVLAGHNC